MVAVRGTTTTEPPGGTDAPPGGISRPRVDKPVTNLHLATKKFRANRTPTTHTYRTAESIPETGHWAGFARFCACGWWAGSHSRWASG